MNSKKNEFQLRLATMVKHSKITSHLDQVLSEQQPGKYCTGPRMLNCPSRRLSLGHAFWLDMYSGALPTLALRVRCPACKDVSRSIPQCFVLENVVLRPLMTVMLKDKKRYQPENMKVTVLC